MIWHIGRCGIGLPKIHASTQSGLLAQIKEFCYSSDQSRHLAFFDTAYRQFGPRLSVWQVPKSVFFQLIHAAGLNDVSKRPKNVGNLCVEVLHLTEPAISRLAKDFDTVLPCALVKLTILLLPVDCPIRPVDRVSYLGIGKRVDKHHLKKDFAILLAVAPDFTEFEHAVRRAEILVAQNNEDPVPGADASHEAGDAVAQSQNFFVAQDLMTIRQRHGS